MADPVLQLQLAVALVVGLHIPPQLAFRVEWHPQSGPDEVIELQAFQIPIVDRPPVMSNPHSHKVGDISPGKVNAPTSSEMYQEDEETFSFTSDLLKSISKRTSFANTVEEIKSFEKTSIQDAPFKTKRNDHTPTEYHSGGCEAKKEWLSLGSDHFPRFIKSYNCTSDTCDRNLGECRAKSYSVKVLRMNSPDNIAVVDEGCDPHLPEKLRCDWKLVPIMVTTYCECFSGIGPFGR